MKTKGGRFFPDYAVAREIWFLWRIELNDKGNKTKVPYSALDGAHARSNDPETWSTYDLAVQKLVNSKGHYDGIGICVQKSDRLVFIDIDHCINENGKMNEIATDIFSRMHSQFIEVSQSGTGLHILVLGEIPRSFNNRKYGVEMYNSGKFASLTGHAICENEPHNDSEAVRYVFDRYKTDDPKADIPVRSRFDSMHTDEWIVEHAMNQQKFRDLYMGRWGYPYNSQSEADLALCSILAFWSDCDPDQMDSIFRSSGLFRKKWERADYRNKTINKAIRNCRKTLAEYMRENNNQ